MGTDYLSWYIESELKRIDPDRFGGEDGEQVIRGGGLRIYTSINYDAPAGRVAGRHVQPEPARGRATPRPPWWRSTTRGSCGRWSATG